MPKFIVSVLKIFGIALVAPFFVRLRFIFISGVVILPIFSFALPSIFLVYIVLIFCFSPFLPIIFDAFQAPNLIKDLHACFVLAISFLLVRQGWDKYCSDYCLVLHFIFLRFLNLRFILLLLLSNCEIVMY